MNVSQVTEASSVSESKILKAEKTTIDYLQNNPDFFQKNQNLLHNLKLPHSNGNTISLIERQVDSLRKNNQKLNNQLNDLFAIAKENESSSRKMHELILALLSSQSINDVYKVIEEKITHHFSVDAIKLKVFTESEGLSNCSNNICIANDSIEAKSLLRIVNHREPVCGFFDSITFDKTNQVSIKSMAVLPLYVDKNICFGCLILGSNNSQHFSPDVGTIFLQNLSEVFSHSLVKYM
ncbi:MAG: DUF484 family protein [Gammaproteobacteria bacterium]|nr:DUF484 family protein [Gammaproteobacteria bacterium]